MGDFVKNHPKYFRILSKMNKLVMMTQKRHVLLIFGVCKCTLI